MTISMPVLFGFSVAGSLLLFLAVRAIRSSEEKADPRRMEPPEL